MDGFSALRACVAQLSQVVDAVERISDTCVMTPEEAASLSHVFVPGSRFNSRTLSRSLKATDSAMRRRMLTPRAGVGLNCGIGVAVEMAGRLPPKRA